jgi:Golgi nucleoside diphosphatase
MVMVSKLISYLPLILLLFSCKRFSNGFFQEKHIIVLDAGSTGSRIYIYKYDNTLPLETISEVAHKRVNPALSTFVNDSIGLTAQLNVLIAFAKTITPSSCWSSTNISLKATAGLRSLNIIDQEYLINVTNLALANSGFLSDPVNTKVISGEEEALFDLLAVTVLFQTQDKGLGTKTHITSLGAVDMGGSSQQIAFSFTQKTNHLVGENWYNVSDGVNSVQSVVLDNFGGVQSIGSENQGERFEVPPVLSDMLGCRPDWRIHVPGTDPYPYHLSLYGYDYHHYHSHYCYYHHYCHNYDHYNYCCDNR